MGSSAFVELSLLVEFPALVGQYVVVGLSVFVEHSVGVGCVVVGSSVFDGKYDSVGPIVVFVKALVVFSSFFASIDPYFVAGPSV